MARIKVNLAINMFDESFSSNALLGEVAPERFMVSDGDHTGIFHGQFIYSANGINGILEGYDYFFSDVLAYQVNNINLSLDLFNGSLASSDLLLNYILSGPDSIEGSPYDDGLLGVAGDDALLSGDGRDILYGGAGNDLIDGGQGDDAALYSGISSMFSITISASGIEVLDRFNHEGLDQVANVETIEFLDQEIRTAWFEKTLTAPHDHLASLLELYVASFNRAPDVSGFAYWGARIVEGMTIPEIAKSFFVQPETVARYPAGTSTEQFVRTVYENVLGREPDTPGLAYWVSELTQGNVEKETFLLAIVNGAKAPSGSPIDAQHLRNKMVVAEHFTVDLGLNDVAWAESVIAGVDHDISTVQAALALANQFAEDALTVDPHLVVQLIGIDLLT